MWYSGNALIGRGGHEPRTRLVLPFKNMWGYPGKKKIYIYNKKTLSKKKTLNESSLEPNSHLANFRF
jgi:hypothetical protein